MRQAHFFPMGRSSYSYFPRTGFFFGPRDPTDLHWVPALYATSTDSEIQTRASYIFHLIRVIRHYLHDNLMERSTFVRRESALD